MGGAPRVGDPTRRVEQSHARSPRAGTAPGLRLLRSRRRRAGKTRRLDQRGARRLDARRGVDAAGRPRTRKSGDRRRFLRRAGERRRRTLDAAAPERRVLIGAARLDERVLTAALTSARAAARIAHTRRRWLRASPAASSGARIRGRLVVSGVGRHYDPLRSGRGSPIADDRASCRRARRARTAIAALEEARRQMSPDDADLRADLERHLGVRRTAGRRLRQRGCTRGRLRIRVAARSASAARFVGRAPPRRSRSAPVVPFADAVAKDLRLAATAPPVLKARWDLSCGAATSARPGCRDRAAGGAPWTDGARDSSADPTGRPSPSLSIRSSPTSSPSSASPSAPRTTTRSSTNCAHGFAETSPGGGSGIDGHGGPRVRRNRWRRLAYRRRHRTARPRVAASRSPRRGFASASRPAPPSARRKLLGALCGRWTIGTTEDLSRAAAALSTAAVVSAPVVAAFLARRSQTTPAPPVDSSASRRSPPSFDEKSRERRQRRSPCSSPGESGSGEARRPAAHRLSARRDRAFCTLNCAALPDDLVEVALRPRTRFVHRRRRRSAG